MKLVSNWQKAWSWFSMQALALIVAAPVIWEELPIEIKALIPEAWLAYIIPAIAVAAMIGRLIDQGSPKGD